MSASSDIWSRRQSQGVRPSLQRGIVNRAVLYFKLSSICSKSFRRIACCFAVHGSCVACFCDFYA